MTGRLPTGRLLTVAVAVPPTTGAVTVGPPLTVKVTVPVGVPGPSGMMVAVSVTGWPTTEGFGETLTNVTVPGMVRPFTRNPGGRGRFSPPDFRGSDGR